MPQKKTTRSANGAGTIRQRSDGSWEARYTTGRDPGTGKQIQKSVYGRTQAAVRKKLTAAMAKIDQGVYTEPARMTVGAWLDIWMEDYVSGHVKPFTETSYAVQIREHIRPALGAVRLAELTTPAIQHFYNDMSKGTGKQSKLSPKSIQNVHGVLHSALKKAVLLRYIPYNPSDACELPRVSRPEIKPLDDVAITAFLQAVDKSPFSLLYQTTLFTGMREGEVLGLTWDNVDFDAGTITIRQQLQREKQKGGKHYLSPTKNGKVRVIAPASYVMQLLRRRRADQAQDKLRAGDLWDNPWNLVFTNELGRHLIALTVYKGFKRIAAEIGMPDARFHDLRHSYAVSSLQAGDDIKTVQENLGHFTAAFTLDVYGHVTEKMKRDSSSRMEAFIESVKGVKNL